MLRGLRRYLNAALIGFIVTFVLYLFIRFDADKIITGIVIALVGAAVVLTAYVYLLRRFGENEPELYDKDGNLVDSKGNILKARSQL